MEITLEFFTEKVHELKQIMEEVRGTESKVNVESATSTFNAEQTKLYKSGKDLLDRLDKLIQEVNYDSSVAQVLTAMIGVLHSDSVLRRNYLIETDTKVRKIAADAETAEKIKQAKKLKTTVQALEQLLKANDIAIPASFYKEGRKLKDGGKGEPLLDLPRIEDTDDNEGSSKRGRTAKNKLIVLGTIENEDDFWQYVEAENVEEASQFVIWHDVPHTHDVFRTLFGSVRTTHNPMGLYKKVEDSKQSVTDGWSTPVEYAGRLWVAKVRDKNEKKDNESASEEE